MKKLFHFCFCVGFFSTSAQATQSLKAQVNGMVCAFCAQGIERKLRALGQNQRRLRELETKGRRR